MTSAKVNPILVTVKLNGVATEMEVDTGASMSIISTTTYEQLWPNRQGPTLEPTEVKLKTFTGEVASVYLQSLTQ